MEKFATGLGVTGVINHNAGKRRAVAINKLPIFKVYQLMHSRRTVQSAVLSSHSCTHSSFHNSLPLEMSTRLSFFSLFLPNSRRPVHLD